MPRDPYDRSRRGAATSVVLGMLLLLWGIELVNGLLLRHSLNVYGIVPRTLVGLRGIALGPFLHASFSHLAVNSLPFLVLGSLVAIRGAAVFTFVSWFTAIVGGVALWGIGRGGAVHVGASGLIFGYFGFLVARGVLERSPGALLIGALTVFLYGSVILGGIVPTDGIVSWEGHLTGLLAGGLSAALLRRPGTPAPTFR